MNTLIWTVGEAGWEALNSANQPFPEKSAPAGRHMIRSFGLQAVSVSVACLLLCIPVSAKRVLLEQSLPPGGKVFQWRGSNLWRWQKGKDMSISATNAYGLHYNSGATDAGGGEVARTSSVVSTTAAMKRQANTGSSAAVLISLSNSALTALRAQRSAASGDYKAYFPAREGFDTSALANTVSSPGATSSLAGKSFAQVASDARERMDAKYAAMETAGKPFSAEAKDKTDGYSLMGDLDRRSLYAVASNEGDRFSVQEQTIAKTIMNQQLSLSMGVYSGPESQAASFKDSFGEDVAARFAAAQAFLDGVSSEEKLSSQWQQQNALVSQVVAGQGGSTGSTASIGSTSGQSKTLFDYLAEADRGSSAASTLFDRSTTYAQLARLKY